MSCSRCGKPVSYMTTVGTCQCDMPETIKVVCDKDCDKCKLQTQLAYGGYTTEYCKAYDFFERKEEFKDGLNEGDEVSIVIKRKHNIKK